MRFFFDYMYAPVKTLLTFVIALFFQLVLPITSLGVLKNLPQNTHYTVNLGFWTVLVSGVLGIIEKCVLNKIDAKRISVEIVFFKSAELMSECTVQLNTVKKYDKFEMQIRILTPSNSICSGYLTLKVPEWLTLQPKTPLVGKQIDEHAFSIDLKKVHGTSSNISSYSMTFNVTHDLEKNIAIMNNAEIILNNKSRFTTLKNLNTLKFQKEKDA